MVKHQPRPGRNLHTVDRESLVGNKIMLEMYGTEYSMSGLVA